MKTFNFLLTLSMLLSLNCITSPSAVSGEASELSDTLRDKILKAAATADESSSASENDKKSARADLVGFLNSINPKATIYGKPLASFFSGRSPEIYKLIIDSIKGVDVNQKDAYGFTSLMDAVNGCSPIANIKLLLKLGADVSIKKGTEDVLAMTKFPYFCHNSPETAKELIEVIETAAKK